MSILNIIKELAADNSRLAKEAILVREKSNDLLRDVLKATYDPSVNYWIKKIPSYSRLPETIALKTALNGLITISERKVTGGAASSYLVSLLGALDQDDSKVLELVIKRDLKCSVSESTINKIWPALIPVYPYQRCSLPKHVDLTKWDWKNGVFSQLKADGQYCEIALTNGKVSIRTRNGSQFPLDEFSEIVTEVQKNLDNNTATQGELVVYVDDKPLPREISNGMMNSILQGGKLDQGEIRFLVWDQIPLEFAVPGGHYKVSYTVRYNKLIAQLINVSKVQMIDTRIVKSLEEAMEHYVELTAQGFEGTIIKTQTGQWKDTTSKEQVKLKVECQVELIAKSLNPGNGKNENLFGSIYCESSDGLFSVNVPGFKDDVRKDIFDNWEDQYKDSVLTVTINGIMKPTANKKNYSSFLPRFNEWRTDKKIADDLQRILDQYDSVIKGK